MLTSGAGCRGDSVNTKVILHFHEKFVNRKTQHIFNIYRIFANVIWIANENETYYIVNFVTIKQNLKSVKGTIGKRKKEKKIRIWKFYMPFNCCEYIWVMRFWLYCYRHSYEISYFFTVCAGISGYNTISQTFMANGCCCCYFVLALTNYAHRREKKQHFIAKFLLQFKFIASEREKKRKKKQQKGNVRRAEFCWFVFKCMCVLCVRALFVEREYAMNVGRWLFSVGTWCAFFFLTLSFLSRFRFL